LAPATPHFEEERAALEATEMTQSEKPGADTNRIPTNIVEAVNKVVQTSRRMLPEIGREPTPEELADRLEMPREKVEKILEIANRPIRVESSTGD
jgi:RNA polymerase primary sigma factor